LEKLKMMQHSQSVTQKMSRFEIATTFAGSLILASESIRERPINRSPWQLTTAKLQLPAHFSTDQHETSAQRQNLAVLIQRTARAAKGGSQGIGVNFPKTQRFDVETIGQRFLTICATSQAGIWARIVVIIHSIKKVSSREFITNWRKFGQNIRWKT
jgi:hypothetical protein